MLSFGKFLTALIVVIIYYFFSFHFITEYLNKNSDRPTSGYIDIMVNKKDDYDSKHPGWISYGNYAAIPSFYIKRGYVENRELITITSICDMYLLYEAQNMALNYKSGPLSFAIYIDIDYLHVNITKLYAKIRHHFINVSSIYDISVGIVAINTSSPFYISLSSQRSFDLLTPLMFKIPTNVLRNLAEHQAQTNWILNIDIDFWYSSDTLNDNKNVKLLIDGLNRMISDDKYGIKTVFVVPAFEIITDEAHKFEYSSLTKRQLTDLVYLEEIVPFHEGMSAQRCSHYDIWYKASNPYLLNFNRIKCYWGYEPWFIIHKNVSILHQYQFDNQYIGRGLNKVERVFKLRYYCFNFIVMHNLFMIHAPNSMVIHHEDVTNEEKEKWHKFNFDLFIKKAQQLPVRSVPCGGITRDSPLDKGENYGNNKSNKKERGRKRNTGRRHGRRSRRDNGANTNIWSKRNGHDMYCKNGILSDVMHKGHCKVCCQTKCGKCGGHGCGKIAGNCCIGHILSLNRYCNTSTAPCQMTLDEFCPVEVEVVDYVSIL